MNNTINKKSLVWVFFSAVAVLVVCAFLISLFSHSSHSKTTIMLVRHAEKADDGTKNPPLTAAGLERAETLLRFAAEVNVTTLYATQYLRTQATLQPLAHHLDKTITEYDAGDSAALVERVKKNNVGEYVIIAGHSNTVPEIIKLLDADSSVTIADDEYDNFYIVTICSCGETKLLNSRY